MKKQEKWLKAVEQLESSIRNRLVLPKTVLQELCRISNTAERALLSIDELLNEDLAKVREQLRELFREEKQ